MDALYCKAFLERRPSATHGHVSRWRQETTPRELATHRSPCWGLVFLSGRLGRSGAAIDVDEVQEDSDSVP